MLNILIFLFRQKINITFRKGSKEKENGDTNKEHLKGNELHISYKYKNNKVNIKRLFINLAYLILKCCKFIQNDSIKESIK